MRRPLRARFPRSARGQSEQADEPFGVLRLVAGPHDERPERGVVQGVRRAAAADGQRAAAEAQSDLAGDVLLGRGDKGVEGAAERRVPQAVVHQLGVAQRERLLEAQDGAVEAERFELDRKSTRLNSSHLVISYAVFCLKKKKKNKR